MKVKYNGETIDIKDKLKDGSTSYDIFSDNINLEDTIEFDSNSFSEKINISNIDKTINLGDDKNE